MLDVKVFRVRINNIIRNKKLGMEEKMMKDKVIQVAGKTWKILGEKGALTIQQLAKTLKEKEDIVNQAIGWLAREDKIKYIIKGNRSLVCLVDSEQQMFNILKSTPTLTSNKK